MPLVNKTGLNSSKYTIYVLGFSTGTTTPAVVLPKMLSVDPQTKTGSFIDTPANGGQAQYIPSYILGDEITSISVDRGDASTNIAGARIYFFAADNSQTYAANGYPPRFPYTADGASVTQVANPPQDEYPIYSYVELTYASGYGTVIDVSTVDGFFFPLTVTLNDSLGQLGQPLPGNDSGFSRDAILGSYTPFMNSLGAEGAPYLDLQYTANYGGLLNPSHHLETTAGLSSGLNTIFDGALNTLFASTTLSISGDASGGVVTDTYTVFSNADQTYPGTSLSHPAIQLQGLLAQGAGSTKITFTIFNPVGFCVVNYSDGSGNLQPIKGSMVDTTLTFTTPLPDSTPLVNGMYVTGAGADASTTIVSQATDGQGRITSLTLSNGTGSATPNSVYKFSKSPDFAISSGNMVYGNYGLFADVTGVTDADQQAVLKGLQRDMVSALNRGVANSGPTSGTAGYTSEYWGDETNWYPAGEAQNVFSYFMHTAAVSTSESTIPIFTQPPSAVQSARGGTMGMAYGFGYDENPVHAAGGQPQVPSKYDPVDSGTTSMTVTLGPWTAPTFSWHLFYPIVKKPNEK